MASSAVLYTPQVLALATGLAAFPLHEELPLRAGARSQACGSTLEIGLRLDRTDRIEALGLRAHACAIGQAAATIFAQSAIGCSRVEIASGLASIAAWLDGQGQLPDWPGFAPIAAARDYPARHGAVLLAWRGALDALPS